ncbi:helix-turn-helix domain-containing protein [Kitasatospora sp. NPDC001574]
MDRRMDRQTYIPETGHSRHCWRCLTSAPEGIEMPAVRRACPQPRLGSRPTAHRRCRSTATHSSTTSTTHRRRSACRRRSMPTQYLTVAKVAERLGTTDRFVRRLVSERRIAFVKMGRHVRISETSLDTYIAAGSVPAVRSPRDRHGGGA